MLLHTFREAEQRGNLQVLLDARFAEASRFGDGLRGWTFHAHHCSKDCPKNFIINCHFLFSIVGSGHRWPECPQSDGRCVLLQSPFVSGIQHELLARSAVGHSVRSNTGA